MQRRLLSPDALMPLMQILVYQAYESAAHDINIIAFTPIQLYYDLSYSSHSNSFYLVPLVVHSP